VRGIIFSGLLGTNMIKKTNIILISGLIIVSFFWTTCDQASLFWTISHEVAPKKPLIDGSPSKMVKDTSDNLYVANGELWEFTDKKWQKIPGPNTSMLISDVAVTTANLYILVTDEKNSDTVIWERSDGGTWKEIISGKDYRYQSIYGAGGTLFYSARPGISARPGTDYNLYKYNNSGADTLIKGATGILRGVVFANSKYFLATEGDGILVYDGTSLTETLTGTAGELFTGIIKIDDANNIVAVTFRGKIYQIDSNTPAVIPDYPIQKNEYFTGALALWDDTRPSATTPKLLLLGVKSSSSYYGYHEMLIGNDGKLTGAYNEPGQAFPTSMKTHEAYIATIEEHAINSLMQAPDLFDDEQGRPVVFASTQQSGLWSLRHDASENENVWNAEE
jgi:hypothetical protein